MSDHLLARANVARSIPLADRSVQCVVTSPPYWGLRDYDEPDQLGQEATPGEYVANMVRVFSEVRRVLRDDGVAWLNLGDSYARGGEGGAAPGSRQSTNRGSLARPDGVARGFKPKDRVGVPHRVVFALQAEGWYWRDEVIWHKPNAMTESVTDRTTKAHEVVFLLAKQERYFYDAGAIREKAAGQSHHDRTGGRYAPPGQPRHTGSRMSEADADGLRNARSVWPINTHPFPGAHFATMPPALAERCIKAGSRPGDVVYDPFNGAGTTGSVALRLGRRYIGTDLNADYLAMADRRITRPHAAVVRPDQAEESLPLFAS